LKVEAPDDLEKRLREEGYSDGAVKEILKWYAKNNDRKT
jgi:predicted Ser/Thr protein kinase